MDVILSALAQAKLAGATPDDKHRIRRLLGRLRAARAPIGDPMKHRADAYQLRPPTGPIVGYVVDRGMARVEVVITSLQRQHVAIEPTRALRRTHATARAAQRRQPRARPSQGSAAVSLG